MTLLKIFVRYCGAMIAVPTATQNIPLAGVRGKYGKQVNLIAPHFYSM